tara:strand:- start:457 stop:2997 length:2541 start_codon:yes stop_codon:yes gene_type:complete
MASSLLNRLKLRAGESIDTVDPNNPNQAIIDRYKNIDGINVEKLTEYVNLNLSEPQTIVDAMLLAEAIGYTPEQAKVVGAQWALESGRGVSTAGADYNYFGIKSHNKAVMKRMSEQYGIDVIQGDVVKTKEVYNGKTEVIDSTFASFKNPIEGFLGKKAFLETNKRYKDALNPKNTADQFAAGLKAAGYATDPDYVNKVRAIYNGPMRTVRPTWMEPTKKSTVSQLDWATTEVQPTEDSRADLVAEKANQAVEQPSVAQTDVDEVLADIKYKPQIPKMPLGNNEEDIIQYSKDMDAYNDAVNQPSIDEAADQEMAAYEANPQGFDNYENYANDFENTMTDEEYEALNITNPKNAVVDSDFNEDDYMDLPEVTVSAKKSVVGDYGPEVEADLSKYDDLEFLNNSSSPRSTISEGSFTNEARSKEQLKRDAAAQKFISDPLQQSAKSGYFGSGQSIFYPSRQNQRRSGGSLAPIIPEYYKSKGTPIYRDTTSLPFNYGGILENGGPGDGEIGKPTNPIDTNKGFFGMIGDAAKYSAARNMSKTELPEQGDLTDNEYLSTLNRKELSSIPFKEQMADRDVKSEKYFVEGVQKRMSDIGLERSQSGTPMKEDYDYLGIPFMYDKSSWFHNLKGNRYENPYSCQGVACAIGRKAGAVNAQDYKTRSARGTAGKPWAIETGSSTVDSADVLAGKGLYPVENIQPGDMIRSGYKTPHGTTHNTIATGNSYITYDDTVEYPAAYASEWQGGVKGYDKYRHDPKTDQAFRYLRNLPALQEEAATAKSTNEKYQDYLDKKTIAKMPAKEAGLIRQEPVKMPFVLKKQSYPNTRKGRKQEKQNNAYVEAYMNKLQKK